MSFRLSLHTRRMALPAAAMLALSMAGTPAQASVVVNYTQVGNQVKGVLNGSFDTSFFGTGAVVPNLVAGTIVRSTSLRFGPSAADLVEYPVGNVFTSYTTSNVNHLGTFDGGDAFAIIENGANDILRLPVGYLSGANLHSEGTWAGSISSLSLKIGATVINLPGNQTLTINVVDPNAVPEPASAALVLLALAGLALSGRRQAGRP